MKALKLLVLTPSVVAVMFVAAPAAAQDVTGTVTVTGTVAAKCLFTTDSDSVVIPELANSTGHLDPATVNSQSAELAGWCNGTASTMSVEANHLEGDFAGSAVDGFTDRVDYVATATAMTGDEGVTPTAASDDSSVGGSGSSVTVGLFASPIAVTFSDASADGRLVAGDYEGSVDVTLSPAL